MHRGYIRVWRKIEDSGIMGNPELCRLFLFLLLKATARPRRQMIGARLVPLEPGQLVVGRKMLAAELGTTEGKIRTCLAALQKMEIISQRATNRFSLVSILNWGRYQHATGTQPADRPAIQPTEQGDAHLAAQGISVEDHQMISRRAMPQKPDHSGKPGKSATNKNKEYRQPPFPARSNGGARGGTKGGEPAIMNNLSTAARILANT